jgi:hypothetical protein
MHSSDTSHPRALQQEIALPDSTGTRITTDDLQSGFKACGGSLHPHLGDYLSVMAFKDPPDDDDTPRASHRIFTVLVDSAFPSRVCLRPKVQHS